MKTTISFKDFLADAVRSGLKTQTRRLMSPQPVIAETLLPPLPCDIGKYARALKAASKKGFEKIHTSGIMAGMIAPRCPYGEECGFELDVLEYHKIVGLDSSNNTVCVEFKDGFRHTVGVPQKTINALFRRKTNGRWIVPRYMYKEFSRTQIFGVWYQPQRLHDITEDDAIAEGVERVEGGFKNYMEPGAVCRTARDSFFSLFHYIHGECVLLSNPFVWAIGFTLVQNFDICSNKTTAS